MSSGLYSHPGVLMEDHINGVVRIAKTLYPDIPEWLYIPLAFHDFGKATTFFQDYINGKIKKSKYTDHSYVSAIYCLHLARKMGYKDRELECFFFPLKHHTDMENIKDTLENLADSGHILREQIESICSERFNVFLRALDIPEKIKENAILSEEEKDELKKRVEKGKLSGLAARLKNCLQKCRKEDFFKFNLYFSLVLDADKTQAGTKHDHVPVSTIPDIYKVEQYKKSLETSILNEKREMAYKEVMAIGLDKPIVCINLPTGLGKTLTGLSLALRMAKEGNMNRIIYCLPFLSIIDQAEDVIRKALNLDNNLQTPQLVVHHHLSEMNRYVEKDREYDFDASRVFTEAWNASIVLTTFYQFFYSLLGFENSNLRRFNKLYRSVIIIDEIQALPKEYWSFVEYMLERLTKELECRVILMTATNPLGFPQLIDSKKYREGLKRYKLTIDIDHELSLEELAERALREVFSNPEKSFMFVLNTISSSQEFYRLIKEELKDIPATYISTAIVPIERRKRIEAIKKGEYRVIVSTQVVEAGVDVDVDVVYRDFAPLDSIVQSAGRCNRHYRKSLGSVNLVVLRDKNGRRYASRIYSEVLLGVTEKTLKGLKTLCEDELLNLVEKYYHGLREKLSNDKSEELKEAVKSLDYKRLSEFRLIQEQPFKDQVFVELDEDASRVLKEVKACYRQFKNRTIDRLTFKRFFEQIKSEFYKYVINVNVSKNPPPIDEELKIYVINAREMDHYDLEIGYSAVGGELIW